MDWLTACFKEIKPQIIVFTLQSVITVISVGDIGHVLETWSAASYLYLPASSIYVKLGLANPLPSTEKPYVSSL